MSSEELYYYTQVEADDLYQENQQLRKQRDAAVEALNGYEYDSNGHITTWLSEATHRAALAKIGEGE
jgi:hypothetical protein